MNLQLALIFGMIASLGIIVPTNSFPTDHEVSVRAERHRRAEETTTVKVKLPKSGLFPDLQDAELVPRGSTTTESTRPGTRVNNFFSRRKQQLQDSVNGILNAAVGITRNLDKMFRDSLSNGFGSSVRDSTRGFFESIFGNRNTNLKS